MLDALSLDQLRTFAAVAEEGSFSAAARKLHRVQSAISDLIGKLEATMGVSLFDRSKRYPTLTKEGEVLLADARSILAGIEQMRARAKGIAAGAEAELSVVIDMMFPMRTIAAIAKVFHEVFPNTPLRLYVEAMGSAYQPILDGRANLGIVGPPLSKAASVTSENLTGVPMIAVAAAGHPLAVRLRIIPLAELAKHVQLVLTERAIPKSQRESHVLSPLTWRLADLSAKRAFLLEGLGWGFMPRHVVEHDMAQGRLVGLSLQDVPADLARPVSAVYLATSPPGPAGRWFIEQVKTSRSQPPRRSKHRK